MSFITHPLYLLLKYGITRPISKYSNFSEISTSTYYNLAAAIMSSKKRKNDDEAGTTGTKVARYTGGGGGGDDGVEDGVGDWAVRPGMIMEVKMRNFMCHQVELEFLLIL